MLLGLGAGCGCAGTVANFKDVDFVGAGLLLHSVTRGLSPRLTRERISRDTQQPFSRMGSLCCVLCWVQAGYRGPKEWWGLGEDPAVAFCEGCPGSPLLTLAIMSRLGSLL